MSFPKIKDRLFSHSKNRPFFSLSFFHDGDHTKNELIVNRKREEKRERKGGKKKKDLNVLVESKKVTE